MVSELRSENQLKNEIDEIKNENKKNKDEKNNNIMIHFKQSNSNTIQFISNFIINYYKDERYKYIFIIHIKRNFKVIGDRIKDRIHTIPDINPDINHLFIDNLNDTTNIKLNYLLNKSIKYIFYDNDILMDLDKEFNKVLKSFISNELNDEKINCSYENENNIIYEDNYVEEIQKYFDEEIDFKEKIIETAKELTNEDEDLNGDCNSLIDIIFKKNYINEDSIDIISCILSYIKDIFAKYLKHIFKTLENNNILKSLLEIKKKEKSEQNECKQLKDNCLNSITLKRETHEPKEENGEKRNNQKEKLRQELLELIKKRIKSKDESFEDESVINEIKEKLNKEIKNDEEYNNKKNILEEELIGEKNNNKILKDKINFLEEELIKGKNNNKILKDKINVLEKELIEEKNNYKEKVIILEKKLVEEKNINNFHKEKINVLEQELKEEKKNNKSYKEKINVLEQELIEGKNNKKNFEEKINILEKKLEEEMQKNKGVEIKQKLDLLEAIYKKDKEIEELKLKISRFPFELNEGEKLISVIFTTIDETIYHSIICKNTDKFSKVEDKFYEYFHEYSKSQNIFRVNGMEVNKYKSLGENKIVNSDIIILNNG